MKHLYHDKIFSHIVQPLYLLSLAFVINLCHTRVIMTIDFNLTRVAKNM